VNLGRKTICGRSLSRAVRDYTPLELAAIFYWMRERDAGYPLNMALYRRLQPL
jgi:hypothetical protein